MPDRLPKHQAFTVCELAAYFRVDESTVWRWIRKGYIASVRIGGPNGTVRVMREDLRAFIKKYRSPVRPFSRRKNAKPFGGSGIVQSQD